MIGNKIGGRFTKVSKTLQQNNSKIIINEHGKEIPKKRDIYISRKKTVNHWISKIKMMMEYQKIINLLDNTPSKFRTQIWIERNHYVDDEEKDNQIKCQT